MGFQAIQGDGQLRWKACGSTMQEYDLFLSLCGLKRTVRNSTFQTVCSVRQSSQETDGQSIHQKAFTLSLNPFTDYVPVVSFVTAAMAYLW